MEHLISFLEGLSVWHWWGLAGVLLVIELLTGTTYLLWPTAAAALVGLAAASPLPFGWELQLIAFAAITTVFTLAGDKFVAKRWFRADSQNLNERARQLLGEKVVAAADFAAGKGRVRLGDSVWAAVLTGGSEAAKGAVLEIVDVDGATLHVKPAA
jgi:membrane protein implicated in regulation of membrane protease activity